MNWSPEAQSASAHARHAARVSRSFRAETEGLYRNLAAERHLGARIDEAIARLKSTGLL